MNPYGYFDNEYIDEQMAKEERQVQQRIDLETERLRLRITELEDCLRFLEQTLVIPPPTWSGNHYYGDPYDLREMVRRTLKGDSK